MTRLEKFWLCVFIFLQHLEPQNTVSMVVMGMVLFGVACGFILSGTRPVE